MLIVKFSVRIVHFLLFGGTKGRRFFHIQYHRREREKGASLILKCVTHLDRKSISWKRGRSFIIDIIYRRTPCIINISLRLHTNVKPQLCTRKQGKNHVTKFPRLCTINCIMVLLKVQFCKLVRKLVQQME